MGKNILWVVVLGVAAGVALPLAVLHLDDIEGVFAKPAPPAAPDVIVKSWAIKDQQMVSSKRASPPAETIEAPVQHSRSYWRHYWDGRSYRSRSRARRTYRPVRRRLDPVKRRAIESQDIAAWREADQMLRVERGGT